ncbi:MAG TPA: L-seryl-tRNA(Sec) selenium transferase [Selenomonadales bacterium]|nr:L-seryl-tRNA(Sec) selenium transferase [Selenomonadales bacterium]
MEDLREKFRAIPAIDRLIASAAEEPCLAGVPRELLVRVIRQATDAARNQLRQEQETDISPAGILRLAQDMLAHIEQPSLRRVINATGVVLHTNLGRAPLSRRARERITAVMEGYSNLEYDVASGERGSRYAHIADRICGLIGAEGAIVVNNNAAAVLLVLSALASGREVIVSRGELVEIGGSFRVPDVLRQSGARLVEVGTTNKTHLYDYERAIGPDTAAILKVHTSNYRIVGFTSQPEDEGLVELASRNGIPVIEDLGSGTLLPIEAKGWREPAVSERLAAGMSVVTFSGDKLFGGSQAGMIAGQKEYIDKMRKHPLLRAIRIDKLSLAALEGTLLDYSLGNPKEDIPVQYMLHISPEELAERAEGLARELQKLGPDWQAELIRLNSQAGGGSLPAVDLVGHGVALTHREIGASSLERRLRIREIPVVVRVQEAKIILDVRCLRDSDTADILAALRDIGEGAGA